MPELPEVETTLKGILPYLQGKKIARIIIRHPTLRWPIPKHLPQLLEKKAIKSIQRRGKYLLFQIHPRGTLILHLGMSGSLRVLKENHPPKKHEHVDIETTEGVIIRFTDPRRFGALLWTEEPPENHPLLKHLGPEPLSNAFTGQYLFKQSRTRKVAIKQFIMNSQIVVGVGNIYAVESLFSAGIHPATPAGTLSEEQCAHLVNAIKKILKSAIKQGGTTLKDFSHSEGKPGYFKQRLQVYGRAQQACLVCSTKLEENRLGQRSTVFCPRCQPK